jgi:hypothetical protein
MAWFWRSLKFAMLFLLRVSAGFWPVIDAEFVLRVFERLLVVGEAGVDAGIARPLGTFGTWWMFA